ncbi:MAG: MFS transporter [Pseudomonadota bacterium]
MKQTLSARQLMVLIAALMSTAIGQSLVFAILAPLGREVGLVELQITSIIASSALVFAIASPHWGRLSDRVGRKPILLIGLIGYTIGTVLFTSVFLAGLRGALTGIGLFSVLLVVRCSQAVIMSAGSPSATAYAADCTEPQERMPTMARLGTANSLGMIMGPAVSGALAAFGLLAPLYFAGALSALAALLVWRLLPPLAPAQLRSRERPARLRYLDPRIRRFVITAVALFSGFSAIQQTLGFQLQDSLGLSGVRTAQYTGVALMIAALFTFLVQVTAMQRLKLPPHIFVRSGLALLAVGAVLVATFSAFHTLAIAMALMGSGLGLTMPAITAGASLAVGPQEQGGAAGVISSCPAVGFVSGPVIGGLLYPFSSSGPSIFAALMFTVTIVLLAATSKARSPTGRD